MPLFLHLTDIHLKSKADDTRLDDHKVPGIKTSEQTTSGEILRTTLHGINTYLKSKNEVLDALIISGDITQSNRETGYERLSETLKALEDSLPTPDRILIVPGNHDVNWEKPASTPDRYNNFVKYVRNPKYITPLLEGLDINASGEISVNLVDHYIIDPNKQWVIIPINSSNYCGSIEATSRISDTAWQEAIQEVSKIGRRGQYHSPKAKEVLETLKSELLDIARISPQQFVGLAAILKEINGAPNQLRIGVIHHQILPVSTGEEFKAFESITNLGRLRAFMSHHNFELLLHGHKHQEFIYRDLIYDYAVGLRELPHELIVVSGAAGDVESGSDKPICRLIKIDGLPEYGTIEVRNIRYILPGIAEIPEPQKEKHFIKSPLSEHQIKDRSTHLIGSNVNDLYDKIMHLFDGVSDHKLLPNVICELTDPSTAHDMPTNYPPIHALSDNEKIVWFNEQVAWWQRPKISLSVHNLFNHGSYIYGTRAGEKSQFESVVDVLLNSKETSKAVIVLLDPRTNPVHEPKDFPSFCSVHFVIRSLSPEADCLECIAYFRKQEMKYWWPVNLAELAEIQSKIYSRLKDKYQRLQLGSIRTIATVACAGTSPPRVAIPLIDRLVDENPNELWRLAYRLNYPANEAFDNSLTTWSKILTDLLPSPQTAPDGVPVAVEGLALLIKHLNLYAGELPQNPAKKIIPHLERLRDLNDSFLLQQKNANSNDAFDRWKERLEVYIHETLAEIHAILQPV